jgi:hypothetical protein
VAAPGVLRLSESLKEIGPEKMSVQYSNTPCVCTPVQKFPDQNSMAVPASYEAVAPGTPGGAPSRSRLARVLSVGALMILACAALVALLGTATEQRHMRTALVTVTPEQSLDELALQFLTHGATMSVKQMEAKLSAWRNLPSTLLDLPTHVGDIRTQMLALGPKGHGESFTTALDGVRAPPTRPCAVLYRALSRAPG